MPRDWGREEVLTAEVEAVPVLVSDGVSLGSVHDEAGDALRVERRASGPDHATAEGPVGRDPKGHEGVVVVGVEDGMGVDRSEGDAHDGAPPVIDPALRRTKGFVAHLVLDCWYSCRNGWWKTKPECRRSHCLSA